ncbi:hypothetical protein EHQ31_06360 [Leptospira montravelensis]|uniref:Lipoprotein n=1 Tax=Leptospira montravelensis TaxID=2484961 RepID=A0ABY2LYV9_9LEPT|nr:hypothetical protein [Leptospira montravelensis]TGK84301.1 hypothetical protein EHQ19_07325 [Leptospira montravelensis]TGL06312.1 hypothetical protein EHQ31_06360 [Leptospira montravelensis]
MKASNKNILYVFLMLFLVSFAPNCVSVQGNYAFLSEKENKNSILEIIQSLEFLSYPLYANHALHYIIL